METISNSLNLAIIAPIFLFFLISAIVCGNIGAKRGPLRALISVGLTLVSGACALFFSKLSAAPALNALESNLEMGDFAQGLTEEMETLLGLSLSAVVSGVIFAFYFGIFAIALKNIVNGIINSVANKGKNSQEIKAEQKAKSAGFKWGGALISIFVDALLLTAIYHLPLYGTMARGAKIVETAMDTALMEQVPEDSKEVVEALAFVADNPVLTATRVFPLSQCYDLIFSARDGKDKVSVGNLLTKATDLSVDIRDILKAQDNLEPSKRAAADLQELLDKNGILKNLVFTLAERFINEKGAVYAETLTTVLRAFNSNLTDAEKSSERDCYTLIFASASKLSLLVNSTNTEELMAVAGNVTEGLARHPKIGVDGAVEILKGLVAVAGEEASGLFSDDVVAKISDELTKSVALPVGEGKFGEFLKTTYQTIQVLSKLSGGDSYPSSSESTDESMKQLLLADKEAVAGITELFKEETFKEMGLDEKTAKTMSNVGDALLSSIASNEFTEEEAEKEAKNINYVMSTIMDIDTKASSLKSAIGDPQDFIDAVVSSDVMTDTLSALNESGTGMSESFASLSPSALKSMSTELSKYNAEHAGDADAAETLARLNELAQFLGLDEVK